MASNADLDRLVLSSLPDLESAARYIQDQLEEALEQAMEALITAFVAKHGWLEGGELFYGRWIAPPEWRTKNNENDSDRWFSFALSSAKDGEDAFALSSVTGAGVQQFGLYFDQRVVKRRDWNRQISSDAATVGELATLGFVFDQGSRNNMYYPTTIDRQLLADSLAEGGIDEALEPISQALAAAVPAVALFQKLSSEPAA
jgi:hypothetical protein